MLIIHEKTAEIGSVNNKKPKNYSKKLTDEEESIKSQPINSLQLQKYF